MCQDPKISVQQKNVSRVRKHFTFSTSTQLGIYQNLKQTLQVYRTRGFDFDLNIRFWAELYWPNSFVIKSTSYDVSRYQSNKIIFINHVICFYNNFKTFFFSVRIDREKAPENVLVIWYTEMYVFQIQIHFLVYSAGFWSQSKLYFLIGKNSWFRIRIDIKQF